ncbi:MAG: DUF1700 domain-containing protein [Clostridium sp.]
MNRSEFLEILKDYLSGSFSESEISDILRDYEEFFLNGELEGKNDEEIISSLGSPKTIANDLKAEMKRKNTGADTESKSSEYVKDAKVFFERFKRKSKKISEEGIKKGRDFLSSNDIINEKIPTWIVKLILIALSLFLIIPTMFVILGIIGGAFTLIGLTITDVSGYAFSIPMMAANLPLGLFIFFISLAGTGVLIALWTIYVLIIKFIKRFFLKYISWIKTKKMYIRVKQNKDNYKSNNSEYDNTIYLDESKDSTKSGEEHYNE